MEKRLAQVALDTDRRSTLYDRGQKAIPHFKYELMPSQVATAEELARSYATVIANKENKLAGGEVPLPNPLVAILKVITPRQQNIIQRAQSMTKH